MAQRWTIFDGSYSLSKSPWLDGFLKHHHVISGTSGVQRVFIYKGANPASYM